jgi:hypothetical protein
MKNILVFICFWLLTGVLHAQVNFDDYFISKTLRVDYILAGNAKHTGVYLSQMKQEPFWGGSRKNLIDTFGYGEFEVKLKDRETEKLIYSRGFCTLFQEWQTTAEAKKSDRAFYQTTTVPFPKHMVTFELYKRNEKGVFDSVFKLEIDPEDYFIVRENPEYCKVTRIVNSGDPSVNVDIAFIAEGYKEDEMDKFREDVKRVSGYLFSTAPFDLYKNKFNIWAVESVSEDSGPDVPGEGIYYNTIVNSSYYTFDVPRYLTTYDVKSIRDIAANVPYDQIYLLINSPRYGGGGIFNHYTACTSDNELTPQVITHEFGHGFAGLGDEYYTSGVAYENFYPSDREPWEPNLTTLKDFDSKWNDMVEKNIPIPTPPDSVYLNKVGVFEGGGYVAKGVYRPYFDCRMKSNTAQGFCPVCQRAIKRMIEFYIK